MMTDELCIIVHHYYVSTSILTNIDRLSCDIANRYFVLLLLFSRRWRRTADRSSVGRRYGDVGTIVRDGRGGRAEKQRGTQQRRERGRIDVLNLCTIEHACACAFVYVAYIICRFLRRSYVVHLFSLSLPSVSASSLFVARAPST